MNSILKLIIVIGVAHLFAVAGFFGWLVATGRVDSDRLTRVREMFVKPIAVEAKEQAALQSGESDALTVAESDRKLGQIPMTSEERSGTTARAEERLQIVMREKLEQLRVRKQAVDGEIVRLAREIGDFESRQSAWEKSIADEKKRETDEQFRKAVRLIESMPPKQARLWILEMVSTGKTDNAVAYLDAMSGGKASNLLKSFKGDAETKVATDLLDRLRMLGLESEARAERNNGAKPAQSTAESARTSPQPSAGAASTANRAAGANRALELPGSSERPRSGAAANAEK